MATFEVTLTAYSVIVVEADNEEQAQNLAYDEASLTDFDIEGVSKVKELQSQEDISRSIRHANQVI